MSLLQVLSWDPNRIPDSPLCEVIPSLNKPLTPSMCLVTGIGSKILSAATVACAATTSAVAGQYSAWAPIDPLPAVVNVARCPHVCSAADYARREPAAGQPATQQRRRCGDDGGVRRLHSGRARHEHPAEAAATTRPGRRTWLVRSASHECVDGVCGVFDVITAGLSAVRSTAPHAVNAASMVAFTSVSSIGPMGGSAARSSSGPVSRSEIIPGCDGGAISPRSADRASIAATERRRGSQASTPILALAAAACVAVGAVMILAPSRIFSPGSGTETLLLRTIGIRDVVLGSGACAACARGEQGELRRWATVGLASDGAAASR